MSITQTSEFEGVLVKVRTWPPEMRLRLAEELLRSLHPTVRPSGSRGVPADQARGISAGDGSPPDDDTVNQWIHEHRQEKYG
jgi:hypothetical protein